MSTATTRNFGAAQRERARRVGLDLEGSLPIGSLAVTGDPAFDAFFGSLHEKEQAANAAGMGFRADLGSIGRFADQSQGGGRLTATDRAGIAGNIGLAGYNDASAARQLALKRAVDQERDAAVADAQGAYQQHVLDSVAQPREEGSITSTTEGAGAPSAVYAGPLGTSRPDVRAGDRYMMRGLPDAHPLSRRQQIMARVPGSMVPETEAALAPQERADVAAALAAKAQASTEQHQRDQDRAALIAARAAEAAATRKGMGRGVTAGNAEELADFDTSLDELGAVRAAISPEDSTGIVAQVGASIPYVTQISGWGSDAKKRQAVIDRVKQVIGKTLEGGVLRKEDEAKYVKILPNIGDAPEVATEKLNGLEEAVKKRKVRRLDAMEDAGYDVSEYRKRAGRAGAGPGAGDGAPQADPRFGTPVEGAQKGIPGIPGGLAKFTNGKWIRVQ